MFNKFKVSFVATIVALAALLIPGLASAHGMDKDKGDDHGGRMVQLSTMTDEGVRVFNTTGPGHDIHAIRGTAIPFLPGLFYKGTITAVSATGFTMKADNDGSSVTVNTASAKLIRIPRTVIALGDMQVNDQVYITGNKTSATTVDASVVYDLSANLKPAVAKGTVTAVTANTITVQTKNDKTITVNTDNNTEVTTKDGQPATTADIQTGAKVRLFGLWDSVLNVFNALKIHFK